MVQTSIKKEIFSISTAAFFEEVNKERKQLSVVNWFSLLKPKSGQLLTNENKSYTPKSMMFVDSLTSCFVFFYRENLKV